jgi:hypothetical protein
MAVAGVLRGTVPGPSLAPRRVVIGGSLGVHISTPPKPGPNPDPIYYGGAELEPKSHMVGPGDDYPLGQLLTMVNTDPANPRISLMAIVDGMHGSVIQNAYLRQGQNGPILMDLLPMMQLQQMGQYDSLLTIKEAALPQHVVQTIAAGNAYVSVGFPASVHPDGAIVGAISPVAATTRNADYNGNNVVDAGDYLVWRESLGQSGHDLAADGNGDNIVDYADHDYWRANFGKVINTGTGSGSHPQNGVSVPEPAAAMLLVMAAAPGIWRRRRAFAPTLN